MDPYEGFREFVRGHPRSLMRTAYLLTGDAPHAEDLLQAVLMRTARRWRSLADGNPEAYVRRALLNEHISWRRRRRAETPTAFIVATVEVRARANLTGAPKTFRVSRIGGWLGTDEVLVTGSVRGDFRGRGPEDGELPTLGETVHAVNVMSGRVRQVASYTYRAWAGDLPLPGF
ncbi:hypothetical protein GCM10009733_068570 [Nonomuraea maheshkhaliensis]|uniref:RNA polymerase sigma-70 region 2 domain-containing protein n=1 Tax=Nonomuraea maheshkhaliensis TaxID=419590 RepID=A0ABP4RSQ1_9ACTN